MAVQRESRPALGSLHACMFTFSAFDLTIKKGWKRLGIIGRDDARARCDAMEI